jgi:methionine aminopeptidase
VVKIQLGAQIDGFASISAETIVIGATLENPVTGRRADVLKAAWHAAELAMRTIKVGNRNWAVTEVVNRVSSTWNCKPVEGELRISYIYNGVGRLTFSPPFQECCLASRPKMSLMARNESF